MHILPVTTLLFFFFQCSVSQSTFDRADINHDGKIDRSEFEKWGNSLQSALQSYLPEASKSIVENKRVVPDPSEPSGKIAGFKRVSDGVTFWPAFVSSIVTIWATEVGDKTFFIAAILSMKHDRIAVFGGAIGALIIMTILSVALGSVVNYICPKELTHYAGAVLFVFFGAKMLKDANEMTNSGPSEELTEVEEELEGKKSCEESSGMENAIRHDVNGALVKVFTQTFLLTFLAEWGDRSQIATITLAASKSPIGVTVGAVLGHSMCTGLAIIGGKMLATKISEKTVTFVGGFLFFLFAIHSFVAGPES